MQKLTQFNFVCDTLRVATTRFLQRDMSGLPFAFSPSQPVLRPLDSRALSGIQILPNQSYSPLAQSRPVRSSFVNGDQAEIIHVSLPEAVIPRRPDLTRQPNRDRTAMSRKEVQSEAVSKARYATIGVVDQKPVDSRLQL